MAAGTSTYPSSAIPTMTRAIVPDSTKRFYLGPPDKPEKWSAEDDGIVWPIRGGSLAVSNIE